MRRELKHYRVWLLPNTRITSPKSLTRASTLAFVSIILVLTLSWSSLLHYWNTVLEICLPIRSTTGKNAKGHNPMKGNLACLTKLHMYLPFDPAIPPLGIYITDSYAKNAKIQKYVFIVSFLILEKDWK